MYVSPSWAAARAVARSPCGCASVCTPTGAKRTGAGMRVPRILVERSTFAGLRPLLRLIFQRRNAAALERVVFVSPYQAETSARAVGVRYLAARSHGLATHIGREA